MKALVCHEFGPVEQLKIDELETPTPGPGDVLVRVHAAGVNFPDSLIVEGKYQFKPPFPFAPGGECAGVVESVGEKVTSVKPGDRVMAMTGNGAFAEFAVAPERSVYAIPDVMPYDEAACFGMTYGTTFHALVQRGAIQPGESLLVTGAGGGVGTAAVELGRALGARVIAAASSDEKLEMAKQLGADDLINYSNVNLKDAIKELTKGEGVEVIYEVLGGDIFEQCMRCVSWNGRLLVIGFASGKIGTVQANLPLLKGASVVGVFWGAFTARQAEDNRRNFQDLFAFYEDEAIKPRISQRFPFESSADAIVAVRDRKAIGKIVVEMSHS